MGQCGKTLGHLQMGEAPAAMSDCSGDPMMGSGSALGQQLGWWGWGQQCQ